jgi:hypothetical protein
MALSSLPSLLTLLLLSFASSSAAFKHSSGSSRTSRFIPNRYIIEVDASSTALQRRGLSPFAVRPSLAPLLQHAPRLLGLPTSPLQILNRTLAAVQNHGIPYRLQQSFEDLPDVFHGASIEVDEGTTMEALASIDGVKVRFPSFYLS